MKKLTVILSEEDFRHIAGALLKTSADFTVETISAAEPTESKRRTLVSADGRNSEQIARDFVASLPPHSKFYSSQASHFGRPFGFSDTAIAKHLFTMEKEGIITRVGRGTWQVK